ncbi:MAG TPA: alpha/beta hydrolase [Acidimicrobiales bacterium]|nr:alpha/beta hydrolase [Acidimicrobiales bacterium]
MAGPPGSPALLLLHGWMATAALNWYGSLEFLGRSFSVVAPNLRGHGRQGRGAPPFSVEACADDLAALINELSLGPAIVVGYSMGGAIAQMLARRHREAVHGLVLCATAASFARRIKLRPAVRIVGRFSASAARKWPEAAHHFLDWRIARHDRTAQRRYHRDDEQLPGSDGGLSETRDGPLVEEVSDEATAHGRAFTPGAFDGRPGWAFAERTMSDLAAFIEAGAELNAYDSSSWLPELEVPAAVLVTARDQVVAPWRQEAMAALIRGARRYVVDAGHDAVVAKPGVFLPVLRDACGELAKLS